MFAFLLVRILRFVHWLSKTQKLCNACFQRYPCGWKIQIMIVWVVNISSIPPMLWNFTTQLRAAFYLDNFTSVAFDFLQIDWLNKFLEYMWPYLDKVWNFSFLNSDCFPFKLIVAFSLLSVLTFFLSTFSLIQRPFVRL